MGLSVYDLQTEYRTNPIGMDCKTPRFSWKLRSDRKNVLQKSIRIRVAEVDTGRTVYDTGERTTRTPYAVYEGEELRPSVPYRWELFVTAEDGSTAEGSGTFETGFLDPTLRAWEGARWIGPDEYCLEADVRGVFGIRMTFVWKDGSTRCGLVFGEGDKRIPDRPNYFLYEVDAGEKPAKLRIFRVGIAETDRPDVPLAEVPLQSFEHPEEGPLLTPEKLHAPHTLSVEVTGNCAFAYLDGVLVDAVKKKMFWGEEQICPRQLNPIGDNDVNTYPRLNRIGFFVPKGSRADFSDLSVWNLREPKAVVFEEKTQKSLDAKDEDIFCMQDPSHTSIPMFRAAFRTDSGRKIRRARISLTSRGIYTCQVNGAPVTDAFFAPGASQYDRRLNYQTYDITDRIRTGENAVGVILSSGWWSDAQTFSLQNFNYYGDRESFLARLVITYEDGTTQVLVTGPDTWKYCEEGPWTYAGFFHGEHYNAVTAERFRGFSEPGYDDSTWKVPAVLAPVPICGIHNGPIAWPDVNQQEPRIEGARDEGVHILKELQAVSMTEPKPGVYLYDMGVNAAGVPKVILHGSRGSRAMLRYGEILYPDLAEFAGRVGTLMVENLRDADCTDLYVFAGAPDGEEYMPRFTFRGYRYIEIRGTDRPPKLSEVKMEVLSSVRELTGQVRVSDPLVDRFLENVERSQTNNFISIPTDCPQRNERMGWAGDTTIFARTATFNADTRLFYTRWLEDMRDLQEGSGKYPDIAPVGGGFGGYTYESSAIQVAFELYEQYGDVSVIRENYDAMQAFMVYSRKNREAGSLAVGFTLGDWLAPEETDLTLICEAFYGNNARLMSLMAEAIGRAEDAAAYRKLYESLRKEFTARFFDPETGRTKDNTQCSYALPLSYQMVEADLIQKVGDRLAEKTCECGYLVNSGFFGTTPICPMLSETGHAEDAYRLMLQTRCPSWLYPVTQGATTVWERWDSFTRERGFGGHNSMNSFDHYSLGAVYEWFYRYVIGIQREENHPGYAHFVIRPDVTGAFSSAEGGFVCPYGRIGVSYRRDQEDCSVTVQIPEGTGAKLCLPGMEEELGSGTHTFHVAADRKV